MDESKVRQIAQQVYSQMNQKQQYGVANIALHTHTGSDSPKINGRNVIPNNKFIAHVTANDSPPNPSITTIDYGISNPSALYFYGIAFNAGVSQKAQITGNAQLGNCAQVFSGFTKSISTNIIQTNSTTNFVFTGGIWVPHVNSDPFNIATAFDSVGNPAVTVNVSSWSNASVTLLTTIASGWTLIGDLIIT